MKKIISILLVLLTTALIGAQAAFAGEYRYVSDLAALLTDAQARELDSRAVAIADAYGCEVLIVTVNDMHAYDIDFWYDDGDAYVFNKYYYETNSVGSGPERSALILVLSMADRDYWLEPYGYGLTAFTSHAIDVMLDKHVLPRLRDDRYYEAFSAYLDKAGEYLKAAREGVPFDYDTDSAYQRSVALKKLAAIIIISALVALIVCTIWKRQMKTAKIARTADNYIPEGGFNLTCQSDVFLYRTVTRRKIERSSSSSSSSSRGSSGRGGKF